VAPVDNLANRLFFELSCVFGFLHLHFSHSDFDNNICLLNWGNATEQVENMERLIELLLSSTERLHLEYPIELAELYRELGKFDIAIKLINGIKDEDQDSFSRLLLKLSIAKTTAPIRYRG